MSNALPSPLPMNIQGALTPPDADGKIYVVVQFADPNSTVLFQLRMTADNAEALSPNIAKMFGELAAEAKRLMTTGGLLVARNGLITPGHPAYAPTSNGTGR